MAFRRKQRQGSTGAGAGPPPVAERSPITDELRANELDRLRFSCPDIPYISFAAIATFDLGAAAAGGLVERELAGHWVDVWQLDPSDSPLTFATAVVDPNGQIFLLALCEEGAAGTYLRLFTVDGMSSTQGPIPQRFDVSTWPAFAFETAMFVMGRQALAAQGINTDNGRVRLNDHGPFQRFTGRGFWPLVQSWQVTNTISGVVPGSRVEVWTGTVDTPFLVDGSTPNPYRTPLVAAAYEPGGEIVAMFAVETLQATNAAVCAIEFSGGQRTNLGEHPELLDLAAFSEAAEVRLARFTM